MEGVIISLTVCVVLSSAMLIGTLSQIGFKVVEILDKLNKTLKEKSQSDSGDKSENQNIKGE